MIAILATSQNWPQNRDWSDRPFDANRGFWNGVSWRHTKPTGRWNVRLFSWLIKYTHPIRWMCDLMERSTVHGLGLWYSGVWLVDTRCRGMACPGVHAFSRRRTQRVAERERGAAVFRYIQKSQNNGYQKGYEPHPILKHYCSTVVRFSILTGTFLFCGMLEWWNWWRSFGAFHRFWKWQALQGTSMNKKSGLLRAKHLLSFFFVWWSLWLRYGEWEECPEP